MNRALYKFSIIIIIFVQFMTVVSILVVWSVIIAYK
jgi:cellulose synthase/poly-beta-1,6-N-acetylglucosamine synthase-like glycosyltransferase